MIASLINAIMFGLATALTAVIPMLYKVFEQLASVEVLSVDRIREIWNNLYIILSVLVLFAIAIKLINAIVNPDVLTDQKKGVKKAFLKAVISVFLVALVPYLFGTLQEIEHKILKDNLIQKYIFNDDSATDAGGELVWVAISSCIDLSKIDAINLEDMDIYQDDNGIWRPTNPTPQSAYFFMLQLSAVRPWATLNILSINTVNQGIIADSIFDFHPVVLFIFLVVLAYELVILVLDTALRAFKLLLLQMMTPIVLGAYVFKDDILKNWFLEYIKTFLQIFLLIIALSFMEYLIPIATNINSSEFVQSLGTSNFLFMGVVRMLLYIGVLRLVKQIGPLINKIFGTNIQAKGGIKGRLGEMAAVGGIAANAWGAIGTKARNAGKAVKNLGATGLKLAGAGAALGINEGWKKYQKNKFGESPVNLQNTKAGRFARAAGTAINGALKGKKITEIAGDTKKAFGTITNPLDTIALSENFANEMIDKKTGMNKATGEHNAKNKDGSYKSKEQNIEERNNTNNLLGRRVKNPMVTAAEQKSEKAEAAQKIISDIWRNRDSVVSGIEGIIRDNKESADKSLLDEIDDILTDYKNGNDLTDAQINILKKAKKTPLGEISRIATSNNRAADGMHSFVTDANFTSERKALASMLELDDITEDNMTQILKQSEVSGHKETIDGAVKSLDQTLQTRLDETQDPTLKAEVNAMKKVAVGASFDAIKSDIYAKKNTVEFKPETPDTPPAPGEYGYEDYYLDHHTVGSPGSGSGSSEPPVINNTTNNYNTNNTGTGDSTGSGGSSGSGSSSGSGGSSDSGSSSGSGGNNGETTKVVVSNLDDVNSTIRGAVSEITGAINSDNRSTRDSLNKAIKEMNNSVEELGDDISKQKKDNE